MRKMVTFMATLLVSVAFMALAPPSATASDPCGSGSTASRFDGFLQNDHPDHPYEGVSGYIVVQDGQPCGGVVSASNFSSAWVMIASNNRQGWAQVGFWRPSGDTLRWFSQFNDGSGHLETRPSTFSIIGEVGVRHTFRVLWTASCGCERAVIDTTNWAYSTFNPFGTWDAQPWSPQFLGETHSLAADIPGTAGARTAFSAIGGQRYTDDALESMPCILSGLNDNSNRWARAASSCIAFTIWTSVL